MNIQQIPEHELARLREKAKEITGSQSDYHSSYTELLTRRLNGEPLQAGSVSLILYRHDILVENNEHTTNADWELILSLIHI